MENNGDSKLPTFQFNFKNIWFEKQDPFCEKWLILV